jgi:uncharacterized protein
MKLAKAPRYLLDVNVFAALLIEDHEHHQLVTEWFNSSAGFQWAICPFTEAGFVRLATNTKVRGHMEMREATELLTRIAQHPGYNYQPISADWHTLCGPFFKRLYGTNQVTDAYLLGLAVHEGLVLVTLDSAINHLAGEHSGHVLVLTEQGN